MRACALLLLLAQAALAQVTDEQVLSRYGVEPNRESIARYLRLMFPDAELRARIDVLIGQLNDPVPEIRDAAMRALIQLQAAPLTALREAEDSEIPEVRRVASLLAERAQSGLDPQLLYAVFRTIRRKTITGLTPEVLNAIPLSTDFYFRDEAARTLLETVRPADFETLRGAAAKGTPVVRAIAFAALRSLDPERARELIAAALPDPSPEVRVAAARELAELGDRRCLPALVALVAAEDEQVRRRADRTLRTIAGKSFGAAIDAAPDTRAAATKAWQGWLAREGATITWKTPLPELDVALGRTLIALYNENKVIEIDAAGRITWETTDIKNPWAVHGMPNGHRLITRYSDRTILEFDAAGKQVWDSGTIEGIVSSVWNTRSGRILAALGYSNNRVVEIERSSKKIVWELAVPGRPVCAVELENGHLLVTLNEANQVVEIDRTGRQLWKAEGLNQPYSAIRIPSGNTLVADYGGRRIVEFDSSGKPVWEFKGAEGPVQSMYTVARLQDGTTMYADKDGLLRIDNAGQVVWKYAAPNKYLYFHRY